VADAALTGIDDRGRRELVVASYNIHGAVGGDGRKQLRRVAEIIAALDADLVALQEVETPVDARLRSFLQQLRTLGYEVVLGHTMALGRHHYGNLLLSRLPILSQQRLDLSQPGREPRGLIDVGIDWAAGARLADGAVLRCLATHLGLSAAERQRQIAAILAHVGGAHPGGAHPGGVATSPPTPLVLMGDFNEWWPFSRRLASIGRRLSAAPALASFPSGWPLLALDRLWYGPGLDCIKAEVVRTKATRAASDHLPLRVRFRLSPR
jgi:endonuclease/exonuclease/phosphatase family metal-dependent hydrolase